MVAPPPPLPPPPPPALTGADLWSVMIFMAIFVVVAAGLALMIEFKLPGLGAILHLLIWMCVAVGYGMTNPEVRFDLGRTVLVLVFGMPFLIGFTYFAQYAIANSPLVLSEEIRGDEDQALVDEQHRDRLIGSVGVAASPLKPAGKILVGERFYDVVSGIGWIEAGERVVVARVADGEIVVERAGPNPPAAEAASKGNGTA